MSEENGSEPDLSANGEDKEMNETENDIDYEDEIKKYEAMMKSKDEVATQKFLSQYYPIFNPFYVPITYFQHEARRQCDIPYDEYVLITEERIAFQLGYVLFMDTHSDLEHRLKSFQDSHIVLLNRNMYDPTNYLIAKNSIPHSLVDFDNINDFDFASTKVLLVGDCGVQDVSQVPRHVISKIIEVSNSGITVFSYNSGVIVTGACFPNYFKYRNGLSTIEKEIKINANAPDSFVRLCGEKNGKFARRAGVRRFSVLKDHEVLIEEVAPSKMPIAVKVQQNRSHLIHMVEFVSEDIFSLRSERIAKEIVEKISRSAVHLDAPNAWRTALSVHHDDSFYLALGLQPMYDAFFGILASDI